MAKATEVETIETTEENQGLKFALLVTQSKKEGEVTTTYPFGYPKIEPGSREALAQILGKCANIVTKVSGKKVVEVVSQNFSIIMECGYTKDPVSAVALVAKAFIDWGNTQEKDNLQKVLDGEDPNQLGAIILTILRLPLNIFAGDTQQMRESVDKWAMMQKSARNNNVLAQKEFMQAAAAQLEARNAKLRLLTAAMG